MKKRTDIEQMSWAEGQPHAGVTAESFKTGLAFGAVLLAVGLIFAIMWLWIVAVVVLLLTIWGRAYTKRGIERMVITNEGYGHYHIPV